MLAPGGGIMSPVTPRIAAIMRLSKWLSIGLAAVLVLLPGLLVVAIVVSRLFGGDVLIGSPQPVDFARLPAPSALLAALIALLDLSMRLLPVFVLQRLFRRWSKGKILEMGTAQLIKLSAVFLLLSALAGTVFSFVLDYFPILEASGGRMSVTLELDTILLALVIYLVGMALSEAARLAEEAELTI